MKKATPTPNRFITYTQSSRAKGFILFFAFFFLLSCLDETSLAGFKKDVPRFEVKFKEFNIPTYTVQADSIRSKNSFVSPASDRLLCGFASDEKFGDISASLFTQFLPATTKINKTGKTDFALTKVTFNLALDYYVYGDTLSGPSSFSLHRITDPNFKLSNNYYTDSEVNFDPSPLATGTYNFEAVRWKRDSIAKYIKNNNDTNLGNDYFDSLSFDLPTTSTFAKTLFDSALSKGIWHKTKITKVDSAINDYRTDSLFLTVFHGLTVKRTGGGRILGFKSMVSGIKRSSRVTMYYSYSEGGVSRVGIFYYFIGTNNPDFSGQNSFSKITVDRNASRLAGLPNTINTNYSNFSSNDNYSYLQSGTGVYAKLDLTAVRNYFDAIGNLAINSAELIIPIEAPSVRPHYGKPSGLLLRTVTNSNRFFVPPLIQLTNAQGKPAVYPDGSPIIGYDPKYGDNYYCISNDGFLDARIDQISILKLAYSKSKEGQYYYRGFLSEYFEYHSRLPSDLSRINYLALVSADFSFGKSLQGMSFKSDQVKLRVYYTQTK